MSGAGRAARAWERGRNPRAAAGRGSGRPPALALAGRAAGERRPASPPPPPPFPRACLCSWRAGAREQRPVRGRAGARVRGGRAAWEERGPFGRPARGGERGPRRLRRPLCPSAAWAPGQGRRPGRRGRFVSGGGGGAGDEPAGPRAGWGRGSRAAPPSSHVVAITRAAISCRIRVRRGAAPLGDGLSAPEGRAVGRREGGVRASARRDPPVLAGLRDGGRRARAVFNAPGYWPSRLETGWRGSGRPYGGTAGRRFGIGGVLSVMP